MPEMIRFLGYTNVRGERLAEFADPERRYAQNGGERIFLTKEHCVQRLKALKTRGESHEETERAVSEWPE